MTPARFRIRAALAVALVAAFARPVAADTVVPLPVPLGSMVHARVIERGETRFELEQSNASPASAWLTTVVGSVERVTTARVGARAVVVYCGEYRERRVWGMFWIDANGGYGGGVGGADDEVARAGCAPEVVPDGDEVAIEPTPGLRYRCFNRQARRDRTVGCERADATGARAAAARARRR